MVKKSVKFYYQQQFYPDESKFPFRIFLRGSLFGENLFTSLRSFGTFFPFWEDHMERLRLSLNFLYPSSAWDRIRAEIEEGRRIFCDKNPLDNYLRIMLVPDFKGSPEEYLLASDCESFEVYPCLMSYPVPKVKRNLEGIKLTHVMNNESCASGPEFFLKFASYGKSISYLRGVRKNGFDDYIRLDFQKRIGDASTSSVFVIESLIEKKIRTPPLGSQVFDAIWRKNLIKTLGQAGWQLKESEINEEELYLADGVFLSNSVKTLTQVASYQKRSFNQDVYSFLQPLINQIIDK